MNLDGWSDWIEKRKTHIFLLVMGFVLVGFGILWWKTDEDKAQSIQVLSASDAVDANSTKLVVDVSGAVVAPGVYYLEPGSRIQQALEAAGGVSELANNEWIDKNLNRSQRLTDGQKIYIPTVDEKRVTDSSKSQSELVNINTATESELDKLPGIGTVTAGKIVAGRPYSKKEELVERKIVTNKVYEAIKLLVEVW